jgi:hypothetical protein
MISGDCAARVKPIERVSKINFVGIGWNCGQPDILCGRYQMIKQRLYQFACTLLRKFCAKDLLGDCQIMGEVEHHHGEIIWLQA